MLSVSFVAFEGYGKSFNQEVLLRLIDSPKTKSLLTEDIIAVLGKSGEATLQRAPLLEFYPETAAFDPFSDTQIAVTIDFRFIPLDKYGTASFLYEWRWPWPIPRLVDRSFWFWGTVVGGEITENTTWTLDGSPYYVTSDIYVHSGVTLTIEPGAVVRFRKITLSTEHEVGQIDINVEGMFISQGAVFITSCDFEDLDESCNGDWHSIDLFGSGPHIFEQNEVAYAAHGIHCSEGAEAAISYNTFTKCIGGQGVWTNSSSVTISDNTFIDCSWGIAIATGAEPATVSNNIIQNCGTGIEINSSSPIVTSNTITGCRWYGIYVYAYYSYPVPSSPTISYNDIADCTYGVYSWLGATPIINYNNIFGNSEYGVYNEDCSVTIDAENNWWGHESGPYHPETNPDGQGDTVSDCVDYDPWATEPQ
jgi:parallel beta-helix repeat protein